MSSKSVEFLKNLNSGTFLLICGFLGVIAINRKSFFSKTVSNFLHWVKTFTEDLLLTAFAFLWILLVVGIPQSGSMIYKWLIGMYLKIRYGSLGKMIDCLDVVGIVETDDAPIVITVLKVLYGNCDLGDLRSRINTTVTKRNPSGSLTYPKFFQSLQQLSGYHCWKPSKFDIHHHVRILDGLGANGRSAICERRTFELVSALAKRPFEADRAPWEILVVPNFCYDHEISGNKTHINKFVIVIRIHHSVGDGYSFLKLIIRDTGLPSDTEVNCPIPATPRRSLMPLWKGTLVFLYLTLRATRALFVEMLARDDNPLFGNTRRKLSGQTVLAWSQPMELDFLKKVKDAAGVGLTTLFVTALTSSVRNYIFEEFKMTPKSLSAVVTFPAPNHPDNRLTNKFSFVKFPLPNLVEDPMKCLRLMEIQSRKMASAPDGPMNLLLLKMVGILPTNLIRASLRNKHSTLTISNLPGPSQPISLWGREMAESMFWFPPMGASGISASFLSYKSKFRLGLAVDTGIITDGQVGAKRLIQGFTESIVAVATAVKIPISSEFLFSASQSVKDNGD